MERIGPRQFAQSITIKPRLENLPQVQDFVQGILADAKASTEFRKQIKLVVDESVANAVDHGAGNSGIGEIKVSCQIVNDSFQLMVEDYHGRLFDPEYFRRIAMVRDWGKGGRGIMLIEGYMDHVSYVIDEGRHTILYMEKQFKPDI